MPKISSTKARKTRVTLDLDPSDYEILDELCGGFLTRACVARKAIRILGELKKGELSLITKNGGKIPLSIIFS